MDTVEKLMLETARARVAELNTAFGREQLAVDRAVDRWMIHNTPETGEAITVAEERMKTASLSLKQARVDLAELEACLMKENR